MNKKGFESWLKAQDRETCAKMAFRIALRAFPLATNVHSNTNLPLITGRALLVTGVMSSRSIEELGALARNAAFSMRDSAETFADVYSGYTAAYATLAAEAAVNCASLAGVKIAWASIEAYSYAAIASAKSPGGGVKGVGRRLIATFAELADLQITDTVILPAIIKDTEIPMKDLLETPLWHGVGKSGLSLRGKNQLDTPTYAFWREWYQGFLDGKPMDWELQKRVALIADEDWERGPKHIAGVIEGIRQAFEREAGKDEAAPEPIKAEKKAVAARVKFNREALALSIAGVLEQIVEFHEAVRGRNDLEERYREDLLAFLDRLSGELETLLHDLPGRNEEVSDEKASKLVLWYKRFVPMATKEAKAYISPENMAKAVVPSGIILGCTAVGTLVAGPAGAGIGTLAGGLIVGHIKPGKAVDELMKPANPPPDME